MIGALSMASAAQAQQASQPVPKPTPAPAPAPSPADQSGDAEGGDSDEIIVNGELRGAVPGDIKPEQQYSQADIRAYGVSSVSDLITQLAPQTYSGRGSGGQPVILLNGRRLASFAEIRDIPTEAIERVDILPEEAALKFGYRADQRVVNIVLRQRFRALTTELGGSLPTAGGSSGKRGSGDILKIARDKRMNVDVQYQSNSAILESERNIAPTAGATVDQRPYRTLVGPSQALTMTGTYAQNLSAHTSLSVNARLEQTQRDSWLGLPLAGGDNPLIRNSNNRTAHAGVTLNGDLAKWRWSVTGNYDRVTSETLTTTNNPAADRAHSVSSVGSVDALISGPLAKVPGGDVNVSFRATGGTSQFDSSSFRSGIARSGSVGRDRVDGLANIDIPITSTRNNFLSAIGDFGINGNVEVEHLSDFGTLTTTGYGARWAPISQVRFIASVTDEENAPSASQLGDPVVFTPAVRVFDFVRNESADITTITGGNPALGAEKRHVFKLGVNARPLDKTDLTLNADFVKSTSHNEIASFPGATAELETAFPSRFVRASDGRLLSIDQRPLNFERASRSELHWGFNLTLPIKSSLERAIEKARGDFEKARDDAQAAGKPAPDPRAFFADIIKRYGAGRPNLGNSIFGGPIFGGPGGAGGRGPGQGQQGQGRQAQGQQVPAQPGQGAPGTPPPGDGQTAQAGQGGQPGAGGVRAGGGGFGGPGGGGGFRGGGGFGGGRGGFGGANSPLSGRLQLSLYHTWRFSDRVLISDALPELDFLDGSAQGSSGGESRHELDLQAGYTKNGMGVRFTGHWESATHVDGGTAGATNRLEFGSLGTLGVRLFADMGQQIKLLREHPWLLGVRVSLGVDNIFDAKRRVTDSTGATPLGYQPDQLDPNGRVIRFTIRKLFL
ncbi:TonB-dependent receptor [Sphingomonas sp.]|uniref:TonB-dependent receptor n=1 Tax=Sphingomonas sp. TaxID=28214 RepID=UPI001B2ECD50|nr:TonB-dependent receptor [Sphingomonas sp.]MBO9714265.1 TonB-dependent receptor [Sphingomonas sp.]